MIETARPPTAAGTPARFRPDIEGLRAVAVAVVVLCHADVPGLGGGYVGVDVFFVISGFLITSLMLRELADTGRLSLTRFYARRARRILPAAAVVLIATILASYHWLGFLRGDQTAADATWAAFFASNVRSATLGVDYLAAQSAPSPVRHYWSLAVEEQFYLVWPLVLVALVAVAGPVAGRLAGIRRRAVPVGLAVATLASFALSVAQGGGTAAYFSAATRAWELGAGCLLALAGRRLERIPPVAAGYLAGTGLALIVVAALDFDAGTPFPGYAAALPVLGAVLVLAGRADALLARAPLRRLGRLSYSVYLWHWPVLTIAGQAHGAPLPLRARLLLVLLAVALAAVTYRCVEEPVRRNARLHRSMPATLAVALVLVAAPPAVAWYRTATSPAAHPHTDTEYRPRLGAPVAHVQH